MKRRSFLVTAGGAAMAAGGAEILRAPNVIAQPKFRWRMPTYWATANDVLLGGAQQFARLVDDMSEGRLKIEVFAGGTLVSPSELFDACAEGRVEMYNAAAYYWAGKEPAVQWFSAVPFGLDPIATYAWYYYGDGLKLWEETYAAFNLVPRPSGATGPQMMGWFKRKLNAITDFKGLKMRIPGLGARVFARTGGVVVLLAPADIYASLERGVIDAAEWIGPHDDLKLGLQYAARYYYYPGWHEPGTTGEFVVNKRAYEGLPVDLRRILDCAAATIHMLQYAEYESRNAAALARIKTEFKDKVELVELPGEILKELKRIAAETNKEESERSPQARKVYASYTKFQQQQRDWTSLSLGSYHRLVTL
jgi:TRAP-type mannitol/chloroaromatic compound transport system substrate-binding protein